MTTSTTEYASVRYLVDDVQTAADFYTGHLGFTLHTNATPAFADVVRGPLRLLLSGPTSSGARATPPTPPDRAAIASTSSSPTSMLRSNASAQSTSNSAATWSAAQAAAKFCSPTPPAT